MSKDDDFSGTLSRDFWDLMFCDSIKLPYCAVCGSHGHLEQHHMVPRSAGNLYYQGRKLDKPTITLCGMGNSSGCHGLTHAHKLHFRYRAGMLEYLITDYPVKHYKAIVMDGWEIVEESGFIPFS